MKKKNKSFRMANYITDKMEFKDLVVEKWKMEVQGHAMFKMVKKLKALKPHLNKLNWKHGNLFDKVATLKKKLHVIQAKIDKDPSNKSLRLEGVQVLSEYKEATSDEEKLLRQKAKITWLKEGDKNSAYFHKVLKGRMNRSRIMSICDEQGKRFDYNEIADQFVKHFEVFMSGKLLGELNATLIALVPKSTTPQKITDISKMDKNKAKRTKPSTGLEEREKTKPKAYSLTGQPIPIL
ncbi:hypothetical protein Tco_0246953 [Tanacetum coccineum]